TVKVVWGGLFPEPETIKIFPLCINAAWIGLSVVGIWVVNVFHVPCKLAWPRAIGAHAASKVIAASTQICLVQPDRSLAAQLLFMIPVLPRNCAL
ncbi:MAG TPA: hypothetical protein VN974_02575, partial [Candidatus Dormibacteraeota bacterium]|nr:hypothetical protein [Candidatus Dormibacteraeota bacterium]